MHGQQNDKYTEMHGQQNDKYTEMHGQQNLRIKITWNYNSCFSDVNIILFQLHVLCNHIAVLLLVNFCLLLLQIIHGFASGLR